MLQQLAEFALSHRMAVSRSLGILFFLTVLAVESTHKTGIFSAILFLVGIVLVGIATVGRLWCSLYISGYKSSHLITTGSYSISRNPLYFFSMLGFIGIGFTTQTFTLGVVLMIVFLIGYAPVIKREEEILRAKFGAEFDEYCLRTPRFIPKIASLNEPESYTVNPKLFRRTMVDVVWFVWFVGIIKFIEALHEYHFFEPIIALP